MRETRERQLSFDLVLRRSFEVKSGGSSSRGPETQVLREVAPGKPSDTRKQSLLSRRTERHGRTKLTHLRRVVRPPLPRRSFSRPVPLTVGFAKNVLVKDASLSSLHFRRVSLEAHESLLHLLSDRHRQQSFLVHVRVQLLLRDLRQSLGSSYVLQHLDQDREFRRLGYLQE